VIHYLAINEKIGDNKQSIDEIKRTVNDMAKMKESERNLQLITENARLREINVETSDELKMERRKYNHKNKLVIKSTIPTVWFIGFVLGLIWYLYSTGYIHLKTGEGMNIIYYILFWSVPMVIGLNRASIVKFGIALLKVLSRKDLTNEDRITLMKEIIQQWLGVYADLSHVVALENKKEKKLKDIINS